MIKLEIRNEDLLKKSKKKNGETVQENDIFSLSANADVSSYHYVVHLTIGY